MLAFPRFASIGGVALFLCCSTALAADPLVDSATEDDPLIYGGQAVQPCAWPSAVYVSFGGSACTGTLVHPEIVITAAHCPSSTGGTTGSIRFGENPQAAAKTVQSTCYSNPGWTGAVGSGDYGYCKLAQPVHDVQIAPPAYGCEVNYLTVGREVTVVGFGQSDNGGSGTKREVTVPIMQIGNSATIGGNGLDSCFGDSGGPVYVHLNEADGGDGTWRSFGIVSGGADCGSGGIYALMHVAIPWIEDHSGVDITPCYDLEGNWAPGPECGEHPTNYSVSNGSWAGDSCEGPTIGFSGICGPAFGSEDDEDPPTVEITSPATGSEYETNGAGSGQIQVTVEADDGEGYGVDEVRLTVNGDEFPNNEDGSEPFEWTLNMPPGGYTIGAIARDYVGLEAEATPITIGIDQEAPEPPAGDGDGDGDGTGDGDGDGDGAPGGDGDGDFGSDAFGEDSEKGCGCSTGAGGAGFPGTALGLLGLLFWRRRRSAVGNHRI
jgi:MYXO-CTERM domain-containing protein